MNGLRRGVAAGLGAWLTLLPASIVAQYPPGFVGAPGYAGTVRVTNRSAEVLTVVLDGRPMGLAPPGVTTAVENVPAGFKTLALMNPQGIVRSTGRFFLRIGGFYNWIVTAPRPAATATVTYGSVGPRLYHVGEVQVLNRYGVPVGVWIGGKYYGVVQPGLTSVFYNIPVAQYELVARSAHPPYQELVRQVISVSMGVRQYVNVMPEGGTLRAVNTRSEPVELLVDGGGTVLVSPGQTVLIPNVPPGTRRISARVGGQEVDSVMAPIYPGLTYTWLLSASAGGVRVVNRTPEVLNVLVDGAARGTVAPGQEMFLPQIPAGVRKLLAMNGDGQVRGSMDLTLGPGETRMWTVESGIPGHEDHPHPHAHPHAPSPHHHHDHPHPHNPGLDHHHPL
jgi:hypothetical protein